jgi:hypothetical protein
MTKSAGTEYFTYRRKINREWAISSKLRPPYPAYLFGRKLIDPKADLDVVVNKFMPLN